MPIHSLNALDNTQIHFSNNSKLNPNDSHDNSKDKLRNPFKNTPNMNTNRTSTTGYNTGEIIPLTTRNKKLSALGEKYNVFSTKKGGIFMCNLIKLDLDSIKYLRDRFRDQMVNQTKVTKHEVNFLKLLEKHPFVTNEDEQSFKLLAMMHGLKIDNIETELVIAKVTSSRCKKHTNE